MKNYTTFTAIDFVQDEDFIRWVNNPDDQALNKAWATWLQQHPGKYEVIEDARRILRAVKEEKQYIPDEHKERAIWAKIESTTALNTSGAVPSLPKRSFSWTSWYSIAATIALIAVAGGWLYQNYNHTPSTNEHTNIAADVEKQLIKYSNQGNKPHVLVLSDGSTITLQPHSSLQYPEVFANGRRDVYLTGEAFFDVARDPHKPFSVYANELVTQVLGTSFTIRAYKEERNILVAVKTGKVSVFTEAGKRSTTGTGKTQTPESALLTPNQQIVFSRDESRMIKSLVDEPTVLPRTKKKTDFHFTDTPVREVFSQLEEAYGVDIIYDQEVLSDCYLNGVLEELSFHDKLRLICKSINARYEILDAHIIISGNGCH